jgi:hypothetical protein
MDARGRRRPADHLGDASMNRRLRSGLAALAGVLAVVGLLTSVFALWAQAVIFDSSQVGDAVEAAMAEPEVTAALAAELTDRTIEAVDLERRIDDLLPDDLSPLAPALVGGVRTAIDDRLEDVLAAESTRALVVRVAEGSHARLMRVLDGDGVADGVTVSDDAVQVNLLPLVGLGLREVQDLGYLGDVEVPELTADGDPEEQIAALERSFGRDLPVDFGQLTVYRDEAVAKAGETVETARRMLQLAKRALAVVLVVTLAAYTATVMLAVRRARTVLVLALASVAVLLIARALTRAVLQEAPVVAVNPGARAAIAATLSSLASGLFTILTLAIVTGVAVAAVAFLRSDAAVAVRLRGRAGSAGSGVWAALRAERDVVGLVAGVLAVAVLVVGGIGRAQILVALLFAIVAVWSSWSSGPAEATPSAPAGES